MTLSSEHLLPGLQGFFPQEADSPGLGRPADTHQHRGLAQSRRTESMLLFQVTNIRNIETSTSCEAEVTQGGMKDLRSTWSPHSSKK